MKRSKKRRTKFMETKYFGFLIGFFLFAIILLLNEGTSIFSNIEEQMLDVHFGFKNITHRESIQEGVSQEEFDSRISDDILIVAIDFNSLSQFGKWPFPRYREADLLNAFSRIQNQNERERSVFLDIFFIEPDQKGYDDVLLLEALEDNGRVFLETVLDEFPPSSREYDEFFERQEVLYERWGKVSNIQGDWHKIPAYYGLQPPLIPFGRNSRGYGHANFHTDSDKVYRRQQLVTKLSRLVETYRLDELSAEAALPVDSSKFERLEWVDKNERPHTIPSGISAAQFAELTAEIVAQAPLRTVDTDNDGKIDDSYYVIRKYQDFFVPAITLSLALDYFNKTCDDLEVILGEYIRIPEPMEYDVASSSWIPYEITIRDPVYNPDGSLKKPGVTKTLDEIKIPIDEYGNMLINYMGPKSFADPQGRKTFPVRSFAGYAANPPTVDPDTWPRTKALGNKIIMVGAFARGIADDEKPTPFGLMYGVEIHANALNTILMDNFLYRVPAWVNYLVLFAAIMLVALISSRMSTLWALVLLLVGLVILFLGISIIFESRNFIIDYSPTAAAVVLTFLSIIAYRVMTEERDKRMIRNMFGKYVSPGVVDHLIDNPPELGGVDKQLTVFFSDVRGFTTLSESMTPQELLNHLNVYFTVMTDIILDHKGTLDKYVGDEIMCFWGAPLPQEEHALLACQCALKQQKALEELNESWPPEKRIHIGIGINSGIMTVGNVGSEGRMNYTLMGDPVNLGARLEGTNKQYGTTIIISEFTYGFVKDKVTVRELDNIRVKGKNKPVLIYELVDCQQNEVPGPAVG
ncbi:adenylate/guanylate cyclase domain-containing protein [Marispirochaeta sp.]|uniref:adenylate/guanylate cyclase domain-containing protein n=1 Tax=Marispirochaeta sp. TaxID=2038653 RepID=UPI0029C699A3|nr:adenylate/guanylate cyclase domain-containing protein [Marispirochaeta sp.]